MSGKKRGRPVYWTPERCTQAVENFVQRVGRRPTYGEMTAANHLPVSFVFQKAVGCGLSRYCQEHGYPPPASSFKEGQKAKQLTWTQENIVKATDQFFQKYGRYPKLEEYRLRFGLPSHNIIKARFGVNAGEYWRQRYPLPPKWTRESALEAVRQFIAENSRLPAAEELRVKNGLPPRGILLQLTDVQGLKQFWEKYFPASKPRRPSSWTSERCIQAVEKFVREHASFPTTNQCTAANGLPNIVTFEKHVGKRMPAYCDEAFPDLKCRRRIAWDREKCIAAMERFVDEHKRPPRTEECCMANRLPTRETFLKYTGKLAQEYCEEAFPDLKWRRRTAWDREKCIAAMERFVDEHKRPPRAEECRAANGLPRRETFYKYTGQLAQEYCDEAFPDLKWRRRIAWDREKCIAAMERFVDEHRRPPRTRECCMANGLPTRETFRKYTGQLTQEFCKERYPALDFRDSLKAPPGYWDRDRCIAALSQYIHQHGDCPRCKDFIKANGLPKYKMFQKVVGQTPRAYCEDHDYPYPRPKNKYWTAKRCIQALEQFLSEHGEFPSHTMWKKETGLPTMKIFCQCVGRTPGQYMRERDANFRPNHGGRTRWDEKGLCEAVEQFAALYGRLPKPHEFEGKNRLPTVKTVKRITGKTAACFLRERYREQQSNAQLKKQGMQMKG